MAVDTALETRLCFDDELRFHHTQEHKPSRIVTRRAKVGLRHEMELGQRLVVGPGAAEATTVRLAKLPRPGPSRDLLIHVTRGRGQRDNLVWCLDDNPDEVLRSHHRAHPATSRPPALVVAGLEEVFRTQGHRHEVARVVVLAGWADHREMAVCMVLVQRQDLLVAVESEQVIGWLQCCPGAGGRSPQHEKRWAWGAALEDDLVDACPLQLRPELAAPGRPDRRRQPLVGHLQRAVRQEVGSQTGHHVRPGQCAGVHDERVRWRVGIRHVARCEKLK